MEGPLPWPRVAVLAGIKLLPQDVAALVCGLPGLQQLSAFAKGEWASLELPVGAESISVTCLNLWWASSSFGAAAHLPRLFRALERLEWVGGCDEVLESDFPGGLSCLTHLELKTDRFSNYLANRRLMMRARTVWQRIRMLHRLRELTVRSP